MKANLAYAKNPVSFAEAVMCVLFAMTFNRKKFSRKHPHYATIQKAFLEEFADKTSEWKGNFRHRLMRLAFKGSLHTDEKALRFWLDDGQKARIKQKYFAVKAATPETPQQKQQIAVRSAKVANVLRTFSSLKKSMHQVHRFIQHELDEMPFFVAESKLSLQQVIQMMQKHTIDCWNALRVMHCTFNSNRDYLLVRLLDEMELVKELIEKQSQNLHSLLYSFEEDCKTGIMVARENANLNVETLKEEMKAKIGMILMQHSRAIKNNIVESLSQIIKD